MPRNTLRPRAGWPVATALAAVLAAGCSSAVEEQQEGAGGAPADGGVLVAATSQDLSPVNFFSGTDGQATTAGLVYDSLIDYPTDSLEPQPSLATSWELAPDGRSLSLQLRDDVTFHSGRPFTSKDVQFSIETYADPARAAQLQRTAAAITGFDTSQDHAIELGFDRPLGNVFDLLDMVPIIDSESIDAFDEGSDFVGTGAFEFTSWEPGSVVEFEANDDCWDGAPRLDGVELRVVENTTSQVSQLRSGQVDLILNGSFRDLENLGEDPAFQTLPMEGAERQVYVGANVDNPALQDTGLREAIAYALDRERVAEEVYRGEARPINLPWPEYSPAHDPELDTRYARDAGQAADLVAKAGRVPTLPLTYIAGDANLEATAQIVQANLEEAGLDVELQPTELSQFLKQLIGGQFEGLWVTEHQFAQYTPSTLTVSAYPFNADQNSSNFVDPGYQRAAEAAWAVVDGTGREASSRYDQLNDELLEHLFLIEMVETRRILGASSSVGGVAWSKRSELDLSDAYLED